MATYMSSLAIYACDDMAPISPQPGVLLVPFKLAGNTEARSKPLYIIIWSQSVQEDTCRGPEGASQNFRFFGIIRVDRALA